MQSLLTKDVLTKIARYASEGGVCEDSQEAQDFLRRIHEFLAFSGSNGHLQKFCVFSHDGCFTIPDSIEIPLKYIDNGRVGTVWDKNWATYLAQANSYDCSIGVEGMIPETNNYYTVYDLPAGGAHILVIPEGEEDVDARVIVSGYYADATTKEVRQDYNGKQYLGEYIEVNFKEPRYSYTKFAQKITGITKSKTKYPVRIEWYNPDTREQGFLCELQPKQEVTTFRRVKLTANCSGCHNLTILARIRIKGYYEPDEILPFTSLETYIQTAQMLNLRDRNMVNEAAAKEAIVGNTIRQENEYTKTTTMQPSVRTTLMHSTNNMRIRRRRI